MNERVSGRETLKSRAGQPAPSAFLARRPVPGDTTAGRGAQTSSPARVSGKEGDCPVTEAVSDRLVRLPMFGSLSDTELDEVVAAVKGEPRRTI